jgi:hypothetical protein
MKISIARIAVLFIPLLIFSCLKSRAVNPKLFNSSSVKELENKRAPVLPDSFITILGRWKINHVVAGDASVEPDDKVIKSLEGKVILFNWRMSVVLGDTCNTPIYDSRILNRTDFLFRSFGQRGNLGITSDTIKAVRLRCSGRTVYKPPYVANNYYYWFIVVDEKTLIMPYRGLFIFLDKVSEKKTTTTTVKKATVVEVTKTNDDKANRQPVTGIHVNENDAADPFHILAALLNSATKLTEAKQK